MNPAHITAVTFTNKAAREIQERLLAHFGDKKIVRAMKIGTFHAICLDRLSKHTEPAVLLDREEAAAIASEIIGELDLQISVRDALRSVSDRKNGLTGQTTDADASSSYSLFFDAYTHRLQDLSVLDFDDLLLKELHV